METYLRRNPVRRWISELEASAEAPLILSPSVTSATAETILKSAGTGKARLYTTLDPIDLALGRSSLTTIRHLMDAGHEVYALEGLRAKMIIVPGRYASIGSQNLTAGVTDRLEATAMTTDPAAVGRIQADIKPCLERATRLYPRTIERLRQLVRPLRREPVSLGPDLDRVSVEISSAIVECKFQEELKGRRLAELKANSRTASRASTVKRLSLTNIEYSYGWTYHYTTTVWTLLSREGSLLRWRSPGETVHITKTSRYLTLVPSTGRLGWARVMKTRITQFGTGIAWKEKVHVAGCSRKVSFESLDPDSEGANLRVKLDGSAVLLDCWFSLTGLELLTTTVQGPAPMLENLLISLDSDWASISSTLLKRLLEPFTYEWNSIGIQAHEFLGATSGDWRLRLATTDAGKLFIVDR